MSRSSRSSTVVVHADGGSRGNPGPAGYGAVVQGPDGEVLAERAGGLGTTTNNVAEYSGLVAGLEAARDLGASVVEVRMDSKLVVEQLSGRWKIKHPALQPLALAAQRLVAEFDRVTFQWVPRARNTLADALANAAMDAQARGEQWRPASGASGGVAPGAAAGGGEAASVGSVPAGSALPDDPAAGPRVDPAGATTLLVVRHGESEWGAQRRYAGRRDIALSPRGRQQAAALAERLSGAGIGAVVSSPLVRCRDTAAVVAAALPGTPEVVVDEAFVDAELGEWTGSTAGELLARDPQRHARWATDPETAPPGGESWADVRRRVGPGVRSLVERHRGGTVLVVTHSAVVKALVVTALGAPTALAHRLRVDTGSLTRIEVAADGSTVVVAVNDTGHLV